MFLLGNTVQRVRLAQDPKNAPALKQLLGEAAFTEFARLTRRLEGQHLSSRHTTNLIFVPGVMGSLLLSRSLGGVWWIDARTRQHLNDLRLTPDGRQDANPEHSVAAFSTDPSYEPFLTAILAREDFGHETFPYDWRKAFSSNTAELRDLINKTWEGNGHEPVHIVAHSMGGLMVRATLSEYGEELWPKLDRIVFIATPHYGAAAIAGYLKNHFWGFELMVLLGLFFSRETFRSLWGVLSMLPAPAGVYPGTRSGDADGWGGDGQEPYVHPCSNFDMYKASEWELDLTSEQGEALQTILNSVSEFHRKMFLSHEALDQGKRDRMAVIAGVGYKTLFRLANEPRFFGRWDKMVKTTDRMPGNRHREGDGRVPVASAALENVQIGFVRGVHGDLPNIPLVYKSVFLFLNEGRLLLPDSPQGALSEHLDAEEGESEAPALNSPVARNPFSDDPGWWNPSHPTEARLNELKIELENDALPDFRKLRLL
jgi:pimeloyl-ACP methyl ester carboxylesterase